MIRDKIFNSQVERYIDNSLNEIQKTEFENLLKYDPQLQADLMLSLEIEETFNELDVIQLRSQLSALSGNQETCDEELRPWFHLAEIADPDCIPEFIDIEKGYFDSSEYLPKIHIKNHKRQVREVLHQIYKEDHFSENCTGNLVVIEDEWSDIEMAVSEKDILSLRESLLQISGRKEIPAFSVAEMEEYLAGNLIGEQLELFESELMLNPALGRDLDILADLEESAEEREICKLREILSQTAAKTTSVPFTLEEIEAFVHNESCGESSEMFENEMLINHDMKAELLLISELNEACAEHDVASLRETLSRLSADLEVVEEKSLIPQSERLTGFKKFSIVAAIAVILLGFSWMIRYSVMPTGGLDMFASDTPTAVASFRTAVPSVNSLLSAGFEQYNQNDFEGAMITFGNILKMDESNMAARYYKGASFQSMGNFKSALNEYRTVVDHNDNIFVEQAEWYMGLCMVNLKDYKGATLHFEAIVSRRGFYSVKAADALKKIQKKPQ